MWKKIAITFLQRHKKRLDHTHRQHLGETYALVQAEVGSTITVTVSYTDGQGTVETATSSASNAVTNVNDDPTGSVTMTGTHIEDGALGIATSAIADEDGLGTFSYQWNRDGNAISGANGLVYTLTQSDVNSVMSVTVSYTDQQGTSESLTSAGTSAVANLNDAASVAVSGTATEDQVLTATVTDEDGASGTITYQWYRTSTMISGANSQTYTLGQADVDLSLIHI